MSDRDLSVGRRWCAGGGGICGCGCIRKRWGRWPSFRWRARSREAGPGCGLYVRGWRRRCGAGGLLRHGMDTVVASDVPVGAGLSSSAALEVAMGLALLAVNGAEMDRVELAAGVPVGGA